MSVIIENETDENLEFDYETVILQVVEASLDWEAFPYEAEVNVVLTDNEAIHETNQSFRGIDSPTDVLSFPAVAWEEISSYDALSSCVECFNPDTGELILGDIMISLDKVAEQARAYGHSKKRELAFLVAHSMLHLLGYDHMEEQERQVMEEKQREILKSLGIER